MAFGPIKSTVRKRRIAAYDLEWLPDTMLLRLVGVRDEKGYRNYLTIRQFLKAELIPKNAGKWYYAHAGGLADMLFVFHELVHDPAYQVSAVFSGSSAIIVRVKRGRNQWLFIDSYWTLKAPLKKIGDALGMPKGECAWDAPLHELAAYNEQDCNILYNGMLAFEDFILGLGGELMMTLASTSMRLFRRAYMQRDIETSNVINDRLRDAYFGGRVEVIEQFAVDGYYYDINSSYPHSMTKPLPASFSHTTRTIPPNAPAASMFILARVKVPSGAYLPVLPYRSGVSMFFPTGEWDGWFAGEELSCAMNAGATIVKVHEVLHFELFDDLARFILDLYERRMRAGRESFMHLVLKILMNSAYGKFAERRDKEKVLINPPASFFTCDHHTEAGQYCRLCAGPCECSFCGSRLYMPGVFLVPTDVTVPHEHVALAGAITARSRVELWGPMSGAHRRGHEVHYCDTDGFSTTDASIPTGDGLGQLKLEKTFSRAWFVLPKVYRIETPGGTIVKAKGMPKKPDGTRFDAHDFERTVVGGRYEFLRTPRIREMLARGDTTPRNVKMAKTFAFVARPKRAPAGDDGMGFTRPWTVDELSQRYRPPKGWELDPGLDLGFDESGD